MSRLLWLSLAACTTTTHHPGSGSGGDAGSGDGAITLDKTGFYDDGQRLWSSTSGPTLTGTAVEAGALHAFVGGQQVGGDASRDGDRWTLALPDGTIGDDTPVTLRLDAAELVQPFALDNAPPMLAVHGSIIDERGDAITFSTGEPVHRHAGPVIALGTGCPDVHKYAYLMDSHLPLFGREDTRNPLAFTADLDPGALADPATAMFRVRSGAGVVVADWAPVALDKGIALYRDVIPALGTIAGELHLEVRITDYLGRTTVSDTCWNHHPMAAPLLAPPMAEPQDDSPDAVPTWTFAQSSPVSRLLQTGHPGNMIVERLVQQTAEPITIEVAFTPPAMSYVKNVVSDILPPTTRSAGLYCGTTCQGNTNTCLPDPVDDPNCKTGVPIDPPDPQTTGATTGIWHVFVVDSTGVGNECAEIGPLQLRCAIPKRGAGDGPLTFSIVASVENLVELRPAVAGPFGEFTLAGLIYTGTAPTSTTRCGQMVLSAPDADGSVIHTCKLIATYPGFVALDRVQLSVTGGGFHITSAPTASTPQEDVAYLANGFADNPPFVWDSGNDDLPGAAH